MRTTLRNASHELLMRNYSNVPVFIQHGSSDDNVPVFHSRRMYQLLSQNGHSGLLNYSELEGKGHWFDEVFTTPRLIQFYRTILQNSAFPSLPAQFSLVVSNPAEMGARGGILTQHLKSSDSLGTIDITRKPTCWELRTSNISRFRLVRGPNTGETPSSVQVDDQSFDLSEIPASCRAFYLDACGQWQASLGFAYQNIHTEKSLVSIRDWTACSQT